MAQDEQKTALGEMVIERRELRLTIICLEEQLRKAEKALNEGATYAARSTQRITSLRLNDEQKQAFENADHPTASELRSMVAELEAARERVKEIDELLALC